MRALAFDPGARSPVLVDDLAAPSASVPDSVLAQVLEVGICGTDREIVRDALAAAPAGSPYLVLGHEMLGSVVESSSTDFGRGDLIVFTVRRPCGLPSCAPCARGESDLCATDRYTERGIRGAHGFLTPLIRESAAFAVRVDPGLRPVGVLLEPLSIAEKALAAAATVQRRCGWSGLESVGLGWSRLVGPSSSAPVRSDCWPPQRCSCAGWRRTYRTFSPLQVPAPVWPLPLAPAITKAP